MERQYISAYTKFNTREQHVNAPLLRRCFKVAEPYKKAHIQISAVGLYRLFLNGKELTKGFFAPYISNPDHIVYYDEYDITDCLKEENVLCILLGNGFSNSLDNQLWQFESAPYRAAPKVYVGVFADDQCILSTDTSFSACASPITFDDIRCGECYDANLEQAKIFTCSFAEDDRFTAAILAEAPKGEYKRCNAAPVRAHETLRVKQILPCENGYIYDFGQNNTGLCRLRIYGKKGQRIDLTHAEVLQNGQLDLNSVSFGERSPQGYVQHDVYVCKEGWQEYLPSFTFHGFQYVFVEGITPEQATEDLLEYVVIHSEMPACGQFSCDNAMINRIQECTLRSDTSNFVCFPMDCPQREKNGWTADASLSAEQMLYNFDCSRSLTEWLCNIRKAQTSEGALPGIVPTSGWGYEWGNGPAWDSVLIELPYQIHRFTGDVAVVKDNVQAICKYFDYLETRLNKNGLLAFGLGDWCEAGTVREEDYSTPVEVTDTLVSVGLAQKAAYLMDTIGQAEEAAAIRAFGRKLVECFREKYVAGGLVTCKTQTAQALAMQMGVFTPEEMDAAYTELRKLLVEADDHIKVGVIGIQPLLNVLAQGGYGELALQLVIQPSFPSYSYNIQLGATTLWESFHEYEDIPGIVKRKDGGERLLSFNHHFWGGVSAWFYKYVAGLQILSYRKVKIAPLFLVPVDKAHAEHRFIEGKIAVDWERMKESVTLSVESQQVDYELCLPDGYRIVKENILGNTRCLYLEEI